jgi:hypothetical protein
LYLFSLTPQIPAVIILKNGESGPEYVAVLRRESGRSGLAMLLHTEDEEHAIPAKGGLAEGFYQREKVTDGKTEWGGVSLPGSGSGDW